jgi:hypothetical protein
MSLYYRGFKRVPAFATRSIFLYADHLSTPETVPTHLLHYTTLLPRQAIFIFFHLLMRCARVRGRRAFYPAVLLGLVACQLAVVLGGDVFVLRGMGIQAACRWTSDRWWGAFSWASRRA